MSITARNYSQRKGISLGREFGAKNGAPNRRIDADGSRGNENEHNELNCAIDKRRKHGRHAAPGSKREHKNLSSLYSLNRLGNNAGVRIVHHMSRVRNELQHRAAYRAV
jgi:hypothetical protein